MVNLDQLIEQYYDKFAGLPNNKPIVRQNQKNDAFEIVVLETLYGKEKDDLDVSKMESSDVTKLSKYIVAPPDNGIDIIIEREEIDGNSYDFIQVKNTPLSQLDIQQAISYMKDTVSTYLRKPSDVNANLKEVLSQTNFSQSDKQNCRYILVHRGEQNYFKGQKEGTDLVITGTELVTIREGDKGAVPRVPKETFESDSFNNFSIYDESDGNPAILMNIRGYDLARLAIKYTNTSLGRNILFGQNLRESLSKSKTYDGMANTIRKEPQNFWFYNNGITVIAEDYDTNHEEGNIVERIILKDFSIINGAQTTSALGKFLKNAQMDNNEEDIEKLKKVFVLTRILKVTDDNFKSQIAIYNNTQNPITTRDMASNREEQLKLYDGLLSGKSPNIYMEIRRGMTPPNDVRLYKHQYTTNLELAQLSYAGFVRDPFIAKDKKNAIFDTDYKQTEGCLLNEFYNRLFHPVTEEGNTGILYKKTKDDINELLFVHYLYKLSKKSLITEYKERINQCQEKIEKSEDESEKKNNENKIKSYERLKAIANICVFYCVAYYYGFKEDFSSVGSGLTYRYEDFYADKSFQNDLIKGFRDLFLSGTITIINILSENSSNLNTWVRDRKSSVDFLEKFEEKIQLDMELKDKYQDYVKRYKR